MKDMEMARVLAREVAGKGGRVCYVGGFVRDRLLGRENKDVDVEVHGIPPEALEEILDQLGTRLEMGSSFGVYGLRGYDLDIAMPRRETATGRGHKDFKVFVDPFIGTEKAARRRDFTVNALMEDVLTGEIIDHFHGREDLKNGVLRHVDDESFPEDALRVLRGAQFAARFQFAIAPETLSLCRGIDLKVLPRERILEELKKALLKAEKPSIFFETLGKMDQLGAWFPEVEALIGVPQSPVHHAEGDVWKHTMLVLDAAAGRRDQVTDPLGFMLSALCHDFGKAEATEFIKGDYHAYQHEKLGLPLTERFLTRLTREKSLIKYVLNMVRLHMKPNMMILNSSIKSTNKMFDEALAPMDLIHLATCDNLGSLPRDGRPSREPMLLERLEIYREYMARPYVMGADLVQAGLKPGKQFSQVLEYAHKLRLAGVKKEIALIQALGYARSLERG